jgi:hypothetical protein
MLFGGTLLVPGTLSPAVVPNEKVAAVTVVSLVTPTIESVKVALWSMKGLCGPPVWAIESFAEAYKFEPFGGPTIVCAGPTGVPRTFSRTPPPPVLDNAHPVLLPAFESTYEPSLAIVRRAKTELEVRADDPGFVMLKLKARSLRFCPTFPGSARRFVRVMTN